ncbi:MAG: patatin-like phospholipase family protein [Sutterellaceae bacterium]|nr:patatin-like phospholipase family protein [Burkholderiaceae bacterium]MCX7901233.1 patatin-like phospholipase family protein [Burkholderiaceae bacterium]MDW8429189.1 patatin-like phospholipase family protein [Sutterellaceae bacterium]
MLEAASQRAGVRDRLPLRTTPAGLILLGGGARAAYQVGVLKAIAAILRDVRRGLDPSIARGHNPFQILVGTSAGAINAAALACRADNFQEAVAQLVHVWENFHAAQVYRADVLGVVRTGARWLTLLSLGWMLRRSLRLRPRSLLDNTPLVALLQAMIDFGRLQRALEHGHLRALAVTASSYTSGRHVTFYHALNDYQLPAKLQRMAVHTPLSLDHLLASAAIPFVFPAVRLPVRVGGSESAEYFGDGAMRQVAPISPAIYLGAERVLVIGAGQLGQPGVLAGVDPRAYPSLAQIAGHALSSIFLDALATDIERLEKMNRIAAMLSPAQQRALNLRPVESLVIAPSQRLDALAIDYLGALPTPVRALLEVLGAHRGSGASLASYLLFESAYTRVLIDLGYADTLARADDVVYFLTGSRGPAPADAPRVVVV